MDDSFALCIECEKKDSSRGTELALQITGRLQKVTALCTFRWKMADIYYPCLNKNNSEDKLAIFQLKDGPIFMGYSFGANKSISGECVFQTGMVGYPESLTDPSYVGQILIPTYPLIGNYGAPDWTAKEIYRGIDENEETCLPKYIESKNIHVAALIVAQYTHEHSHHAAKASLSDWLCKEGVPALYGIDTRTLVKMIRTQGCLLGRIMILEHSNVDLALENMSSLREKLDNITYLNPNESNLIEKVSVQKLHTYTPQNFDQKKNFSILAVDVGIKANQIRCFLNRNIRITLAPWNYNYIPDIQSGKYHGLFISNGPGDPSKYVIPIEILRKALQLEKIPIFGICLGHQLLALAAGAKTKKLPFGNRGHNIPCRDLRTKRCYITSQNHGYEVDASTIPDEWEPLFINMNDGSNEGLIHKTLPFMSVQFHPEASSGPQDTEFLFDEFIAAVETSAMCSTLAPLKRSSLVIAPYIINPVRKCLILGSGGLSIGQAGEFDYSGSQAIKALKEEGIFTILINPNIATVQTSSGLADKVYFLPVTPDYVRQVIELEKPDSIYVTFGGQTALNVGVQMRNELASLGVQVLGTPIEAIMATEDRDLFSQKLQDIGEKMALSYSASTTDEAIEAASRIGYPIIIRAAYTLGGLGSGFADSEDELRGLCEKAFSLSPQVLVERSMKGWKEIEYEVVRDAFDNCITVCNMENFDPLGIHTGDSIVIAPSQTLSDTDYQMLRNTATKVIRHLGIIGECNIQYALDPKKNDYCIIEVNARLSRSSALASKATGYPLAFVAAKLGLGKRLDDIPNVVTQKTTACFEPSLDYCVVKIPRWDLQKFSRVSNKISSAMKSVGEVMSIGRTFEEALQKGIRALDIGQDGFVPCKNEQWLSMDLTERKKFYSKIMEDPSYDRLLVIANALWEGLLNAEEIHALTKIDTWFLKRLEKISIFGKYFSSKYLTVCDLEKEDLWMAKRYGFSDRWIAIAARQSSEIIVRKQRNNFGIRPFIKQIDTVAGEFPCYTNYLYRTYNASQSDDNNETLYNNFSNTQNPAESPRSILVLGSGVYRIGSSVEFDWCSVQCVRTLKKLGWTTLMMNYNPETVSTDFDEVDRLYFDTISLETVLDIWETEHPYGVVVSMGGQVPNTLALSLDRQGVKILGTEASDIDKAENRYKFSRLLDGIHVAQPQWKELQSLDEAKVFCHSVGYPVLVRPSYVLSGAAMRVVYTEGDLAGFLSKAAEISGENPVVITKFIERAKEIEVDAVSLDGQLLIHIVSEHVENAGVHSGDATLILPPQDLTRTTLNEIETATRKIAAALCVTGPLNIQFMAKDDKIQVIECNVRASRSFPFVSKVCRLDLIELATYCLVNHPVEALNIQSIIFDKDHVAVKVPQFSFGRLAGADPILGVEMASTGEVACFGKTKFDAYLKALSATSFRIPRPSSAILFSIGSYKEKLELLPYAQKMIGLGYRLYATEGTADFLEAHGVPVNFLVHGTEAKEKNLNNGNVSVYNECPSNNLSKVEEYDLDWHMAQKKIALYINLPSTNHYRRPANFMSRGYRTRRLAIDLAIPLITNINCAKLFIDSLVDANEQGAKLYAAVDPSIDCLMDQILIPTSENTPGLFLGKMVSENPFYGISLTKAGQLNRATLHILFTVSQQIHAKIKHEGKYPQLLKGKLATLAFFEPSTRTANSFEAAIVGLGGSVIRFNEAVSSSLKGESLQDCLRTLAQYSHLLIVRHPKRGIIDDITGWVAPLSVINAGDGNGEHPTQALLDLFTIREELGTINGLTIALVGDLQHSRTVHSLLVLLAQYHHLTIYLVSAPGRDLFADNWPSSLKANPSIRVVQASSLEEVISFVDVLYMTRMQKERTQDAVCYPSNLILTHNIMTQAKSNMIVMHPLPRNDEISPSVDTDPRAAYFRQVHYGLIVRMALVYLMLTKSLSLE